MSGRTVRDATCATLPVALLLLLVPAGPDKALAAPAPASGPGSASAAATTTSTTITTITTTTSPAAAAASTTEPPQTSTRRSKPLWNMTQTDRLKHDLLLGYDKFARPAEHDERTDVDLVVVIKHVHVDEFAGIMTLDAWVKMFWTDPKLAWKPSQYGNLSLIFVADHEIWQPDIMLYNSATGPAMQASNYESSQMVVNHEGGVIWVPMTRLEVYCEMVLTFWPYDRHSCEFRMGSWVYDKMNMDINVHNETLSVDPHIENELWRVTDTAFERKESFYSCCPEMYVDVSFTVTAQRRPVAYYCLILVPLVAAFALMLAASWLPAERTEKTILYGVNILVLTITLMYLTHIVPVYTPHPPLVVRAYGTTLYMAAFAAVLAVLLINMTRAKQPWPLPWFLRLAITAPSMRWFMMWAYVEEIVETSRTGGSHPESVSILSAGNGVEAMQVENTLEMTFARNRRDWHHFAIFVERCVMLLYAALMTVLFLTVA